MKSIGAEEAQEISEHDVERLKLEKTVYQESGTNPVTISVVLPTFNNGSDEYLQTMIMIMRKIGKLIDRGAIDELVIVDGSRDEKGQPDYDFIKFMLALCIKHCKTFSDEVNFVKSLPQGKQKALGGRFDFSVRFLSQLDPLLHKIFLDHELLTEEEIEFLKKGKGAGLWYSVPVTYGDILCFVDSDIKSFRKFYVGSLCKPILETWRSDNKSLTSDPKIVYTKAVYTRKNETLRGNTFGGRLARVGVAPIFSALNKMGVFSGLEKIEYPLSGEYAFSIDALKSIRFSNGYDIETSILCQLWREFGTKRMAQVDMGIYQHIPGDEKHAMGMMAEIAAAFKYWTAEYGLDVDGSELCKRYEQEAVMRLDEFKKKASEMEGFVYDKEEKEADLKRIKKIGEILRNAWQDTKEPKLLHSWKEIEERANSRPAYSYQNLKLSLRKRINKFTSSIISSSIYIDKSDDIIQKYSGVYRP